MIQGKRGKIIEKKRRKLLGKENIKSNSDCICD